MNQIITFSKSSNVSPTVEQAAQLDREAREKKLAKAMNNTVKPVVTQRPSAHKPTR